MNSENYARENDLLQDPTLPPGKLPRRFSSGREGDEAEASAVDRDEPVEPIGEVPDVDRRGGRHVQQGRPSQAAM